MARKPTKQSKPGKKKTGKTIGPPHPWRICPLGQHWVVGHPMKVPPSKANPQGSTTLRSGHCADNPSHKDSIYPKELKEIAEKYFPSLGGLPAGKALGFKNGNEFDDLIRGWTKYWNEVLQPKEPLDPDLVKALIASESSFNREVSVKVGKGPGKARGLMQVTDETQKILADSSGEITDFLVHVDQKEMTDPCLNIAAGIRWLFHKKHLAEKRAKKDLSWEDDVQKYKAYKKKERGVLTFLDYYERLKK